MEKETTADNDGGCLAFGESVGSDRREGVEGFVSVSGGRGVLETVR